MSTARLFAFGIAGYALVCATIMATGLGVYLAFVAVTS